MVIAAGNHHRRIADPNSLSVLAHDAIFRLEAPGGEASLFSSVNDWMVFLRNVACPFAGPRQPFVRRVAKNSLDLRADVEPLTVYAELCDVANCRHLFDQRAVLRFCLHARAFRNETLVDIARNAYRSALSYRRDGHFDGNPTAVLAANGNLLGPFAGLRKRRAN